MMAVVAETGSGSVPDPTGRDLNIATPNQTLAGVAAIREMDKVKAP
jgi:hypothetical protein